MLPEQSDENVSPVPGLQIPLRKRSTHHNDVNDTSHPKRARVEPVTPDSRSVDDDELPPSTGGSTDPAHGKRKPKWTQKLQEVAAETKETRLQFLEKSGKDFIETDAFEELNKMRSIIATAAYEKAYVQLMNVSLDQRDALQKEAASAREVANAARQDSLAMEHKYVELAKLFDEAVVHTAALARHALQRATTAVSKCAEQVETATEAQSSALAAHREAHKAIPKQGQKTKHRKTLHDTKVDQKKTFGAFQIASKISDLMQSAARAVQMVDTHASSTAIKASTVAFHAREPATTAASEALKGAKADLKNLAKATLVARKALGKASKKAAVSCTLGTSGEVRELITHVIQGIKDAEEALAATNGALNKFDNPKHIAKSIKGAKDKESAAKKCERLAQKSKKAASAEKVKANAMGTPIAAKSLNNLHGTPYDRFIIGKIFDTPDSPGSVRYELRNALLFAECLSYDEQADSASSCWFLRNVSKRLYQIMYKFQEHHNLYTKYEPIEQGGDDYKHVEVGRQLLISPAESSSGNLFGKCLAYHYWPYSTDGKWILDAAEGRHTHDVAYPNSLEVCHHPTFCERNKHASVNGNHLCFRPSHLHKITKAANGLSKYLQYTTHSIASNAIPPTRTQAFASSASVMEPSLISANMASPENDKMSELLDRKEADKEEEETDNDASEDDEMLELLEGDIRSVSHSR
ncbi:hypothetical protein HKX48_008941 [Thoreauomyces humboldtii]|nr:hypothetical protein HKX48_008941 [Thoreauomyces humboldtii]